MIITLFKRCRWKILYSIVLLQYLTFMSSIFENAWLLRPKFQLFSVEFWIFIFFSASILLISNRANNIVKGKCHHKNSCLLHATNLIYGDPCIGTHKYLSVWYRCMKPRECANFFMEFSILCHYQKLLAMLSIDNVHIKSLDSVMLPFKRYIHYYWNVSYR